MMLECERKKLLTRKMLRTDIAQELYRKYYHLLFEFSKDLKNTNVQEIKITPNAVTLVTRQENILLNCAEGEMTAAMGQLILAGAEKADQDMFISLVRALSSKRRTADSHTVFFDIGANIGWYSLCLAKRFPNIRIHAFEPVKPAYQQFLMNIALNRSGLIHAHNFGFADTNRTVDFYVSPSVLAASSLADTLQSKDRVLLKGKVRKLDDYCLAEAMVPDVIKCDVEGAEFLVFKGAERVLSESRPVVMTELLRKWSKCFNYHPNEVIDFFRRMGYGCYIPAGGKLKPFRTVTEVTRASNYFFLHKTKHEQLLKIHR